MSSSSPTIRARSFLRLRFVMVALACVAVVVGIVGAWSWLARGASHPMASARLTTLVAANCAHAVATEPPGAIWFPITSMTPGDIAATMESGWLPNLESRYGPLTMDMPALVYPLNMNTGYDLNDCPHWVATFHDNSGGVWGDIDYVLDASHERVRFSGAGTFIPSEFRFGKAFPYITQEQALALVRQQPGVAGATSAAPMLVFFSLKQGWAGNGAPPDRSTSHFWNDSGTVATDPMWRIAGADGKVYFVGDKLHVYAASEIPMA